MKYVIAAFAALMMMLGLATPAQAQGGHFIFCYANAENAPVWVFTNIFEGDYTTWNRGGYDGAFRQFLQEKHPELEFSEFHWIESAGLWGGMQCKGLGNRDRLESARTEQYMREVTEKGYRIVITDGMSVWAPPAREEITVDSGGKWGALAINARKGTQYGWAVDHETAAAAEARALAECKERGEDCHAVLLFHGGCGAFAADQGRGDAYGWGVMRTRGEAEARAMEEARKRNAERPLLRVWGCNSVPPAAPIAASAPPEEPDQTATAKAEARRAAEETARAAAEEAARREGAEQARVQELNDQIAARHREQAERNAAAQAEFARKQQEYEAGLARAQQQKKEFEAELARVQEQQAAYEKEMAEYHRIMCERGDTSHCK